MRHNPLLTEVLVGLTRRGYARLYCLGLLTLQAGVLFVWWPKGGVDELLASQHSPYTLTAVVMTLGAAMAYLALRVGSEEVLLPGQHGLRDWAHATGLGLGRILRGYLSGQLVHSLYLLLLSAPLLMMSFTVSGGEWMPLGWCVAAALMQAMFYRLCGAITHLTLGHHEGASLFAVRTILAVVYVPIGWFVPATSHLALTFYALEEVTATRSGAAAVPNPVVFLTLYAALTVLAALAVYGLLRRERVRFGDAGVRAGFGERTT